jgi:hypothetical protein
MFHDREVVGALVKNRVDRVTEHFRDPVRGKNPHDSPASTSDMIVHAARRRWYRTRPARFGSHPAPRGISVPRIAEEKYLLEVPVRSAGWSESHRTWLEAFATDTRSTSRMTRQSEFWFTYKYPQCHQSSPDSPSDGLKSESANTRIFGFVGVALPACAFALRATTNLGLWFSTEDTGLSGPLPEVNDASECLLCGSGSSLAPDELPQYGSLGSDDMSARCRRSRLALGWLCIWLFCYEEKV